MKKIETIAAGARFAAAAFGKTEEWGEYLFEAGPGMRIPGKVFGGAALGTTGCEFSLQRFAPGTETGFLHTHRHHEELYFVLSGAGEFQVDGTVFPVTEGCVVRVAPAGRRSVRNNGAEPLAVLCVQYAAGSFGADDAADGELLLGEPVVW
ncbi:cupin domain-containing protein [uncultured Parabacteroides sp.]|jgi:mannose-6-phosphate isomerase-like protein (cupin superfamily)|uniref:cupin domain-containing protein n=1 Tax=uncultured Parabacteroides sp. TaxID=512312 RepID=UPI0026EAA39C|nr:cupin domain-containing protein [uncultured Parabacteroides sp.]